LRDAGLPPCRGAFQREGNHRGHHQRHAGDDVLAGTNENDTINGLAGNDTLSGLGGYDTLSGGAGNDVLNASGGLLDGGEGTDTADYRQYGHRVSLDLQFAVGNDLELVSIENLVGTNFDDRLDGDDGSNVLTGLGGDDTLIGDGGDDVLYGGAGADYLIGDAGGDTVSYANGTVGVRVDLVSVIGWGGEAQGDLLDEIENIDGSQGSDTLSGTAGANTLAGWGGDDVLLGRAGDDVLRGGGGNDRIEGGDGADDLYGDAGDDTLYDSSLPDASVQQIIDGGSGTDTADYSLYSQNIYLDLRNGIGGVGNLTLVSIENLTGTAFDFDTLIGNAGSNVLYGLGGSDTLRGEGGDDVLRGGAGADQLNGGAGTDTASYYDGTIGVNVDLFYGTASGGDAAGDTTVSIENVTGSQGNDKLNGTVGANTLAGWGGDDLLSGQAGADRLDGGTGIDTASYYGYLSGTAGVTVDLTTGTGTGGHAQGDVLVSIENVTGSVAGNDTLSGNAGANILAGWGGNDVLRGRAGADRLEGGAGTDTASYDEGTVGVTVDLAAGTGSGGNAQGDVLVSIESVDGSQGNDSLSGNAGANTLAGWDGDDVLRGGAGADRLDGGAGSDTASYYTGSVKVVVNLATGTGAGGDAQGDTYVGIENVNGSTGADEITGSAQANALNGWAGQDVLTGGGGADRFVFSAASHSAVGAADRITDFSHAQSDRVDLSAIDANTAVAGNQAFSFIGSGAFTHHAGELRAAVTSPGVTTIAGDLNGDGVSDFHIQLTGAIGLVAADFVL
jgi:Ca2+-binding RTX toxin-like protein